MRQELLRLAEELKSLHRNHQCACPLAQTDRLREVIAHHPCLRLFPSDVRNFPCRLNGVQGVVVRRTWEAGCWFLSWGRKYEELLSAVHHAEAAGHRFALDHAVVVADNYSSMEGAKGWDEVEPGLDHVEDVEEAVLHVERRVVVAALHKALHGAHGVGNQDKVDSNRMVVHTESSVEVGTT